MDATSVPVFANRLSTGEASNDAAHSDQLVRAHAAAVVNRFFCLSAVGESLDRDGVESRCPSLSR
jgi:hypothetical protein